MKEDHNILGQGLVICAKDSEDSVEEEVVTWSDLTMSSSDLRDRMDGLQWEGAASTTKLEAIMPGSSFLYARGQDTVRNVLSSIMWWYFGHFQNIWNIWKIFKKYLKI